MDMRIKRVNIMSKVKTIVINGFDYSNDFLRLEYALKPGFTIYFIDRLALKSNIKLFIDDFFYAHLSEDGHTSLLTIGYAIQRCKGNGYFYKVSDLDNLEQKPPEKPEELKPIKMDIVKVITLDGIEYSNDFRSVKKYLDTCKDMCLTIYAQLEPVKSGNGYAFSSCMTVNHFDFLNDSFCKVSDNFFYIVSDFKGLELEYFKASGLVTKQAVKSFLIRGVKYSNDYERLKNALIKNPGLSIKVFDTVTVTPRSKAFNNIIVSYISIHYEVSSRTVLLENFDFHLNICQFLEFFTDRKSLCFKVSDLEKLEQGQDSTKETVKELPRVKTKIIDGVLYSNDFEPVKKFLKDNPDKTLNVFQNISQVESGFILITNSFKLNFLCWSDDLFDQHYFYQLIEFENLKIQADLENSKEPAIERNLVNGVLFSNDFDSVKRFFENNRDNSLYLLAYQNIVEFELNYHATLEINGSSNYIDKLFEKGFYYKVLDFQMLKRMVRHGKEFEDKPLTEPEEIPELDVIRIAVKNKLTRLIYPGKYVLEVTKIDSSYSKDCYHVLKDNREVKMAWGFIQKNMFPDFSNSPIYIVKGVSGVYDAFQEFKEGDYLVRKTLLSEPKYIYGYIVSSEKVEG